MKNYSHPLAQITIPNPCREDWTGMELTESGRFCGKCEKSVMDFSLFSDEQLLNYLEQHRHSPICGRIPISKLNKSLEYFPVKQRYSGWWLLSVLAGSGVTLNAQVEPEKVQLADQNTDIELSDSVICDTSFIHVRGFLEDHLTFERLPFAIIEAYGKRVKTFTDVNGEFELKIPANLKQYENFDLTISYVGYQTKRFDYTYAQLNAMQGSALQLQLDLAENTIIGEVICIRAPWHKRVWYKVKRIFKHKPREIE
jgi:hypothetical protein